MRRNHRFFERESKRQTQNEAGYNLRRENLEHRNIVYRRSVVENEYQRNKQRVGNYRRQSGQQRLAAEKIRSQRTQKRCESPEYHIENSERRKEEVGKETPDGKTYDCFGEYQRKQNQNLRYAKLYRAERYCRNYGEGKIQGGDNACPCHENK